nr:MAG: putative RNA-dependent RNA polymerase [Totiviridae sp.]
MCVPHLCLFENLIKVEKCYLANWLSEECFNSWMSINGGDYQLGKGGKLSYLWDDRLEDLKLINQNDMVFEDLDVILNEVVKITVCSRHKNVKHCRLFSTPKGRLNRNKLKGLNKLFPFYDSTDKMHTNIDLASLIEKCLNKGYIKIINKVLTYFPIGTTNSIVVATIIHAIGNPYSDKIWKLMDLDKYCCYDSNSFKAYFKAISIAIRRTSIWYDNSLASLEEITACSYWELSLGRHGMRSDWDEEYFNRVNCPLPLKLPQHNKANNETNEAYLVEAEIVLMKIMRQLVKSDQRWPTWREFCMDRHSWLTSGSAGAKYIKVKGQKVRLNKRSYMETISINDMEKWLDEVPAIYAIASEKYEMGKARAIYGTEVADQAIMSYLLTVLEPKLHEIDGIEGSLTGLDEVLSIIRRVNIVNRDGEECTMLDYSDFNRQHTLQLQSLIFRCLQKRLEEVYAHPDAIRCAKWCADALLNQYVKFPGEIEFVKVIQGMFSGLRGTNFINTLLNKVYFEVGLSWINIHLKIQPIDLYVLHQGDDVWVSNKSRLWAISLYRVLQNCGLIFSDKKQIQDKNMAEFLRVLYNHDGARGYLGRCVATTIMRPLQSELEISPTMKAIGINSQIQTCFRRGLNIEASSILWDAIIPFALKSRIEGLSEITIPVNLVCRSFVEGGLDIGKPSTMAVKCGSIPPVPVMRYESKSLEEAIPQHTSHAYIEIMSQQIQEAFNSESIQKVIHASNVADSIPQSDKIRCLRNFHDQVKKWKDKIKTCNVITGYRENIDPDIWFYDEKDDDNLIDILQEMSVCWETVKISAKAHTDLEIIFQCIAQSPYKDIATAQRAKDLSVIDAAKCCIYSSKAKDKVSQALKALSLIQHETSNEILSRILNSIRGYGPSMESFFNPVPLSFITNYAIDKTVREAMSLKINKLEQWDQLLEVNLRNAFKTSYKHKLLVSISNY